MTKKSATQKAIASARAARRERRNKRSTLAIEITHHLVMREKVDPKLLAQFRRLFPKTYEAMNDPKDTKKRGAK